MDIQSLTLGEVAKIEELSGQSITAIGEDDQPKGKALAAMAFVLKRREDPKFKWNDAMGLTFDEANQIIGFDTGEADQPDEDAELAEAVETAMEAAGEAATGKGQAKGSKKK